MTAAKMVRVKNNPGIFKRGSRYVIVWRHRGQQHKQSFRTLAEAREAKAQRDGGDRKPSTRASFEDYARAWIDGYAGRTQEGFSEQSRAAYRDALERFAIPFFEGWKLADVEPPDVRRYIRHLEGQRHHHPRCKNHRACDCPPLAPASVVKNLGPVKAMFATAVEDGALRVNPTVGVRVNRRRDTPDTAEQPEKAMTRAELARLMAEIPPRWTLFFELLAKSGLRISEALGLNWEHVEFGARPVLHVRQQCYRGTEKQLKTKNGRRDLPLSPGLGRALWAARPAHGEGAVFATRDGNRLSDRNVRRVLDAAADRAGVPWVHFHTFRHTCASMLFDGGKNIKQVSRWLGHADEGFTLKTYVHLMDDGLGGAEFLDTAVGNRVATADQETAANAGLSAVPPRAGEGVA